MEYVGVFLIVFVVVLGFGLWRQHAQPRIGQTVTRVALVVLGVAAVALIAASLLRSID